IFCSYLLDLHSTCCGGHEDGLSLSAVDHNSKIEFFFDWKSFFDEDTPNQSSLGPSLMRDQGHTENFRGDLAGLLDRLRNLHAAAFTTSARMDLRFYHHSGGAFG